MIEKSLTKTSLMKFEKYTLEFRSIDSSNAQVSFLRPAFALKSSLSLVLTDTRKCGLLVILSAF